MTRIATALVLILLALPSASPAAEDRCEKCGMGVASHAHSRAEIVHESGAREEFCSVTCAIHVAQGNAAAKMLVADYDTRELLDAAKAFWVIGGEKPGVMTREAKWSFAEKARAEAFIATSGGRLADWTEVVRLTRDEAAKADEEAKGFFSK